MAGKARRELRQWHAKHDEELRQWHAKCEEELQQWKQQLQSTLQAQLDELQAAYEDKVRTLVAKNCRLRQENNELRAECAELREARGLLDFIKTQRAPGQPPQ